MDWTCAIIRWPFLCLRGTQILMGSAESVTCEQGYLAKTVHFGNSPLCNSKERSMAPKTPPLHPMNDLILLILFTVGERNGEPVNYRMRVACAHVHPGERDRIEMATKAMLGEVSWTPIPDGGFGPSPEWLVRRALWMVFTDGLSKVVDKTLTISLGKL